MLKPFKTAKISTRGVNSFKHYCIHEAGHVLTALACRHRIDGVNVQPVTGGVSSDTTFTDTDYWQISIATCCLGGPSASRLYFNTTIEEIRQRMTIQTERDFNQAMTNIAKAPNVSTYQAARIFADCSRLAHAFLSMHTDFLQSIADTLYRNRTIPAEAFMNMSFMVGREIQDLTPALLNMAREYRIDNTVPKGLESRKIQTTLHQLFSRL